MKKTVFVHRIKSMERDINHIVAYTWNTTSAAYQQTDEPKKKRISGKKKISKQWCRLYLHVMQTTVVALWLFAYTFLSVHSNRILILNSRLHTLSSDAYPNDDAYKNGTYAFAKRIHSWILHCLMVYCAYEPKVSSTRFIIGNHWRGKYLRNKQQYCYAPHWNVNIDSQDGKLRSHQILRQGNKGWKKKYEWKRVTRGYCFTNLYL